MELSKLTVEIFSKLEQQWLSTQSTLNSDTKKTKILSIDGGDTSVLIAAAFLLRLEETIHLKTRDSTVRVVDYFDIIAGTGSGGLLAVFLSVADSSTGRPLFSAVEAVNLLTKTLTPPSRGGGGLFRRRKSTVTRMTAVIKEALGNKTLKDTCKPILVPCYDTATSAPFVFSRAAASASEYTTLDFELWKVCAAAIATPAAFTAESVDGKTSVAAVDGGLVMNNPAAAAVTHVLHNKVDYPAVGRVEDLLVLSLGNGTLSSRGNGEKWSGDSKKMVKCVVDVAVDGVSESVDQMLGNAFAWNRNDYVRIQANGLDGSGPMTMEKALKERGVESLTFGSKRMSTVTNGDRIDEFVQRLVTASVKSSLPPSPFKSLIPLLDGR